MPGTEVALPRRILEQACKHMVPLPCLQARASISQACMAGSGSVWIQAVLTSDIVQTRCIAHGIELAL